MTSDPLRGEWGEVGALGLPAGRHLYSDLRPLGGSPA